MAPSRFDAACSTDAPRWVHEFATALSIIAIALVYSPVALGFDLTTLPLTFAPWLILLLAGYCASTQLFKVLYMRRYREWL